MKNEVTVTFKADTHEAKERLSEIEQIVDRLTEKISRLKESLADVIQTADES